MSSIGRNLPVIMSSGPFVPLKHTFWFSCYRKNDIWVEALQSLAKKELSSCKNAEDFEGNIVIIPGVEIFDTSNADEEAQEYCEKFGLECRITSINKENDKYNVSLRAFKKVQILNFTQTIPLLRANVSTVWQYGADAIETKSLRQNIYELVQRLDKLGLNKKDWLLVCEKERNMHAFADYFIYQISLRDDSAFNAEELIELFYELNAIKRLKAVFRKLQDNVFEIEEGAKIDSDIGEKINKKNQERIRHGMLHQKKQALIQELQSLTGENGENDFEELEKRIEEAGMSEEAYKVAKYELARLKTIREDTSEFNVAHQYLDWLCSYPWNKSTEDNFDLRHARQVLDEDHYGLEKVKKRIIELLAVRKLNPKKKGAVLCWDGPPGTGKTSIVKEIARALGRKHVRISLGGVDDEAKVRGHKRTYVGALPGCIVKAMVDAGTNNPVLHFDEIDKIRATMRGDPSGALLEVLDPEQNYSFSDNYFGVGAEIDLSQVIVICTSNYKYNIHPTLRDRLEIIDFPGYTRVEKKEIATRHLIPKQLIENGLEKYDIKIEDETLWLMIGQYTNEAGVRNLERAIADVLRSRAVKIVGKRGFEKTIKANELQEILGPIRFERSQRLEAGMPPGVATGLAYTAAGGTIIIVESLKMPKRKKKGELLITGQLGEVMTESAQVAFTCAKKYFEEQGGDLEELEKYDFHVHFDRHGIGKEGPSAGAIMTLVFISLITDRPIRTDFAMTGEINLRGQIMPIGGVKQKLLAAHRAGYRNIFIPERNKKDLVELPDEIKEDLNIMLAKKIDEVVKFALL